MAWQICGQPIAARELKLIEHVTGSRRGVSRTAWVFIYPLIDDLRRRLHHAEDTVRAHQSVAHGRA